MATGARTTYTDTTNIKRAIGDMMHMISWTDTPLLNKLGLNNESKFKLLNWPNTKVEWLEDEMSPRSGTINEALDDSETGVDVQTGEGAYLKTGDIMKVDSELMYVVSVATDTVTVVRGYNSIAATHSDDAVWERVSIARLEGAAYTTGHTTTVTAPYNHTQILSEAIEITRSQKKMPTYGYADTMAYHLEKMIGGGKMIGSRYRAGTLPILLENTFWHMRRGAGSNTVARSMGGFNQFVTTNVTNLAGGSLTLPDIEDNMQTCVDNGAKPDTILVGSFLRRKISEFYKGYISTDRSEERGGSKITTVQTDFGDLEVMWHPRCPAGELYMFEADRMGWITFDSFDLYPHDTGGDSTVTDVVGEYSFVLVNEEGAARIYGASTTS